MDGDNGRNMMIDVNTAVVHHLNDLMAHKGQTTTVLSHTLVVIQGIESLLITEQRRQCGSTRIVKLLNKVTKCTLLFMPCAHWLQLGSKICD